MRSQGSARVSSSLLPIIFSCLLLASLPFASAYEFDMVFQTKCIYEEISFETAISGHYEAYSKDEHQNHVPISVRIESPLGEEVFYKNGESSSDFHLKNVEAGEYKICFTAKDYHTAQNTQINLKWSEGADATDWESVAKKENLDSVHTELLRLEDTVHTIHLELQHIRRKEEQMRDINELTNARIAWFSVGALITCVGISGFQIWNLRKFLVRKKIL